FVVEKPQGAGKDEELGADDLTPDEQREIFLDWLHLDNNFGALHGHQKTPVGRTETAKAALERAVIYYNENKPYGRDVNYSTLDKRYRKYKEEYYLAVRLEKQTGHGLTDEEYAVTYQGMQEEKCRYFERFDVLLHNNPHVRPAFEAQMVKNMVKFASRAKDYTVAAFNEPAFDLDEELVTDHSESDTDNGGQEAVGEYSGKAFQEYRSRPPALSTSSKSVPKRGRSCEEQGMSKKDSGSSKGTNPMKAAPVGLHNSRPPPKNAGAIDFSLMFDEKYKMTKKLQAEKDEREEKKQREQDKKAKEAQEREDQKAKDAQERADRLAKEAQDHAARLAESDRLLKLAALRSQIVVAGVSQGKSLDEIKLLIALADPVNPPS
ncbi:hypothetical protein BGZ74_004057, partial [Mortierella antarctica]